jgi:histidyl-tRNA synthetase
MIFEVVTSASAPPPAPSTVIATSTASRKKKSANPDDDVSESVGVGSICGGGRYDDLVGRFAGESRRIPCVGMSVGIERVFALLKAKASTDGVRGSETEVFVMAMGNISVEDRLAIVKELWNAGIKVSPFLSDVNGRRRCSTRLNQLISPNSLHWLSEVLCRLGL